MNYLDVSKAIMSGEKIFNLPLKVCFYARVSTDSDVQLNSLENQLDYYKNYIKTKPKWTYIDGYVDEGISGVRVEKRTAFKKMIEDAKLGKFDLVITKEVSRFARDLEDSIHYIRMLKDAGVGIYFENQNLNTFDSNSELILNIMFNLAQDESRKLSSRVKFGHRQAIRKGHVLGSSNIIGYKKDKCKLVIIEKEAEVIKKIFELYAGGEYGFYKLSRKLGELGYYNKKGNFYDKDTLKRIINNPKYKGFYRGKTSETVDYRTKKRIKINRENQVIYKCDKDIIPAIVSEQLWDKANQILIARTKKYKDNNYYSGGLKYPLSSKIYCKSHNTTFQRSHGSKRKNRPTWSCNMYLKYRLDACVSPIIAETDLYNILKIIMKKIIPNKNEIMRSMIELYNNASSANDYNEKLKQIECDIQTIEDKKSLAFDLIINGDITKDNLKIQFENFEKELQKLKLKKENILKQMEIFKQNDNMDNLSNFIEKELDGASLEDFIRKFVDEIIVSKIGDDRYNIKLDIYLNLFGEEKTKTKGARHINGALEDEIVYLEKQTLNTIEVKRTLDKANSFTYNVYIEPL